MGVTKVMKQKKVCALVLLTFLLSALLAVPALAAPMPDMAFEGTGGAAMMEAASAAQSEGAIVSGKAIACGIAIGLAAGAGAIAMGIAVAKANGSIARQPESAGNIRSTLMLGLVFIETAIIYALLVVILIIFVL